MDARLKAMGEAMRQFGRRGTAARDGRDGQPENDEKLDPAPEEDGQQREGAR